MNYFVVNMFTKDWQFVETLGVYSTKIAAAKHIHNLNKMMSGKINWERLYNNTHNEIVIIGEFNNWTIKPFEVCES